MDWGNRRRRGLLRTERLGDDIVRIALDDLKSGGYGACWTFDFIPCSEIPPFSYGMCQYIVMVMTMVMNATGLEYSLSVHM